MNFISELKKPFNLISFCIGVLGIILSIVFYYYGKKEKGISYLLNEPTSLIFDSQNSSPKLKLYEQDSIPVIGNVYLLTGSIWNSGDFPITEEDIRLPLSINLSELNRILDFKITRQSDSSISNFNLIKEKNNSLKCAWNYFDPNFGFAFQVIYVGSSDPKFKLNGKVLDIAQFSKIEKIEKHLEFKDWLILVIGFLLIILISTKSYFDKKRGKKIEKIPIAIAIILLLDLIIILWLIFFYETNAPF